MSTCKVANLQGYEIRYDIVALYPNLANRSAMEPIVRALLLSKKIARGWSSKDKIVFVDSACPASEKQYRAMNEISK